MQWATLLAAATALAGNVAAQNMLRFACSQLVVERTDPLVNPGVKYTPHLHQIVGGDSFNITMDPANDPAQLSKCTSCSFVQDKSNYWTAVMFFKAKNGSATNTDNSKVKLSNICHRCWTSPSESTFVGGAPCSGSDTVAIPKDPKCKLIRQTIIFPTCWDGKNLDSPDHQSHVAYGQGSGANGGGACPSTHPVKLPQIMYELMWDVNKFADKSLWPTDGSDPFVYSMNIGYVFSPAPLSPGSLVSSEVEHG
ncbi:hypothetical protein IG631_07058 [Alternaria alternata]|nr:hypothetical protein IG631_07058 [Alternaria alternata]